MAGVVHIPWYATLFRHERFAAALQELAPIALEYGATQVQIHQSRDDNYKFDHMCWFETRDDWERFWEGDEMVRFRGRYSGWYQVPVLYVWNSEIARIEVEAEPEVVAVAETTVVTETPADAA